MIQQSYGPVAVPVRQRIGFTVRFPMLELKFQDDALCRPESRREFRALLNLGYTEAWASLHNERHVYSYWDYYGQAFDHDNGLRIDHLLLSPQAADRLVRCEIDREPRGKENPSDHTPVWCELADA